MITLGEIVKGVGLAEHCGLDMRGPRDFLFHEMPALPFDADAAIARGRLLPHLRGNRDDERRLVVVAQIAAIAEVADLDVCSRNHRDFERLGVTVFNPFAAG